MNSNLTPDSQDQVKAKKDADSRRKDAAREKQARYELQKNVKFSGKKAYALTGLFHLIEQFKSLSLPADWKLSFTKQTYKINDKRNSR